MSMALNIQPSKMSMSDLGYERVFSAAMGNLEVDKLTEKTFFPESFYKDLRLVIVVSAWALENGVMTSADGYTRMRELARELRNILENPAIEESMTGQEYERLKEACLDFAEITCAVGIQRDGKLFELTTGLDANGLPCKTD